MSDRNAQVIRAARVADWPAIRILLEANALPLDGAQEHLADFLVAEENERVVGCAGLERHGDAALLRSCAVDAHRRGIGLGAALTRAAIARAEQSGLRTLALLTTTADHYFPRFGFVACASEQLPVALQASAEFQHACPASAVAMRLDLASPTQEWQLAQANIAYMKAPADDPLLANFVARLDEINRLAEASPGFVWRHVSDSRDPSQREYDDPHVLFNMSVWNSIDALHAFTYRSAHAGVFARRKEWFDDIGARLGLRGMVLWWVPAGHCPTVEEARQRLARLTAEGPTPAAFTFKQAFDADGMTRVRAAT